MLKKPLFCALIASTSAGYAHANVTLYGVVDSGITYISNEGGSSSTQVKDGVLMGSRLGFRGQEDLGGGYKVAFTLEQGINLNTGALGQGGLGFGRQAFLAFKTPYGDVSLGRQYDFMQKFLNPLNIGGWATTYAGHHGDLDRISGNRVNSAIRYDSPDINGLTFGAMYANKTSSSLQTFSGGAGYNGDGWSLAFAYFRQKGNTIYPDLQMGFSDFLGVAMSGKGTPVTLDKQETIALGGSYNLGDITLKANTTTTSMELGSEKARQKVFEFGAQIPVSARVTAFAAWQHSRMAGYTWNQPTVGGWYNLSKRTWIYNAYSYMKASKGIAANQGAGFYFGNSSNNKQGSIRLGLIHMF